MRRLLWAVADELDETRQVVAEAAVVAAGWQHYLATVEVGDNGEPVDYPTYDEARADFGGDALDAIKHLAGE
jgi:hypothetical protein